MTLNTEQRDYEQSELQRDALKTLVLDELKNGSGRSQELAKRVGEEPGGAFTRLLHEMESDGHINWTWMKGYYL